MLRDAGEGEHAAEATTATTTRSERQQPSQQAERSQQLYGHPESAAASATSTPATAAATTTTRAVQLQRQLPVPGRSGTIPTGERASSLPITRSGHVSAQLCTQLPVGWQATATNAPSNVADGRSRWPVSTSVRPAPTTATTWWKAGRSNQQHGWIHVRGDRVSANAPAKATDDAPTNGRISTGSDGVPEQSTTTAATNARAQLHDEPLAGYAANAATNAPTGRFQHPAIAGPEQCFQKVSYQIVRFGTLAGADVGRFHLAQGGDRR